MKKSVLLVFVLLLLSMPLALALTEKTINIKSEPDRNFVIRVKNPSTDAVLSSVYGKADSSGNAQIAFNTSKLEVYFTIIVRYNGETEKTVDSETFTMDEDINIELRDTIPEPVEEIKENNTELEESKEVVQTLEAFPKNVEEQTEETQNTNKTISGLAISDTVKDYSKKVAYTAIVVLILVLILIGIRKYSHREKKIKVVSLEQKKQEMNSYSRIQSAEAKLEETRKEIEELKKKEIEKEERRIAREQQKLARLRGEKPSNNNQVQQSNQESKKIEQKKDEDEEESFY